MYVYLYDNFLRQKKFQSTIRSMEIRLTDFGIAGKILRLQRFTNAEAIVKEEIARGATTIVIVGNDETFGRVLSRAATLQTLFGFLPVGPENSIAEVLGIPLGEEGCDVLSKRRKVSLDVGWFNNRYFVSQLHIPLADVRVEYDEKFSVSSCDGGLELVICNLRPFTWKQKGKTDFIVHPQDGKLEAFLRPMIRSTIFGKPVFEEPSVFPFEEMVVRGEKPFLVDADGKQSKETRITIRLAKKRITMIVGKERQF